MQKRLCQPNTRKCDIKGGLNRNDDRVISRNIEQYQRFFADINDQYIDIHQTKRQTDRQLSSCSILKTLIKFVSQCSLVSYVESGLWNVGNELENCDFAVV